MSHRLALCPGTWFALLADMKKKLRDVMTAEVQVIHPTTDVRTAALRMSELDTGVLPVCDGDQVVGMITDRDIAIRVVAEGISPLVPVREVMTSQVVYAYEDQTLEEAAQVMEQEQVRRLVVLDRDKNLVGIASLGDIAVKAGKDRISGEILEEVSKPVRGVA
jgi:CBS domain-containing protein